MTLFPGPCLYNGLKKETTCRNKRIHVFFWGIALNEIIILGSEAVAGSAELGFVKEEFLEVKLECEDETENSGDIDHQTKTNRQGNSHKLSKYNYILLSYFSSYF